MWKSSCSLFHFVPSVGWRSSATVARVEQTRGSRREHDPSPRRSASMSMAPRPLPPGRDLRPGPARPRRRRSGRGSCGRASGSAPSGSETATAPASRASSAARSGRKPGARNIEATATCRRPSARNARTASPVAGGADEANAALTGQPVAGAPHAGEPGDGLVGERVGGARRGQHRGRRARGPARGAGRRAAGGRGRRGTPARGRGSCVIRIRRPGWRAVASAIVVRDVDLGVVGLAEQQRHDDDLVVAGLDQPVDDLSRTAGRDSSRNAGSMRRSGRIRGSRRRGP